VRPGEKIGGILAEAFPDATNLKEALRALDGRGLTTDGPISPMAFYYFNRYPIEVLYRPILDDLLSISTGHHFSLFEDQGLFECGHDLF
jgi:hypothetical protein